MAFHIETHRVNTFYACLEEIMVWVCIMAGLPVKWLLIYVWPLGQKSCIVKKCLSLNAVL